MITRTRNTLVIFSHTFELKGVDRSLPPGEYCVVTDEQLIEELSFPVYRRVSEMVAVDPRDLQAAQDRDKAMTLHSTATPPSGSQASGMTRREPREP
jgi:hypothetical protein